MALNIYRWLDWSDVPGQRNLDCFANLILFKWTYTRVYNHAISFKNNVTDTGYFNQYLETAASSFTALMTICTRDMV